MKDKLKKLSLKSGAIFLVLLIALYLLCRYAFPTLYTPEWGARNFFVLPALIVLIPSFLGKVRFSSAAFSGYVIGVICGEVFGGFKSHIPPQFVHYGWIILILCFIVFCSVGILFEKKKA